MNRCDTTHHLRHAELALHLVAGDLHVHAVIMDQTLFGGCAPSANLPCALIQHTRQKRWQSMRHALAHWMRHTSIHHGRQEKWAEHVPGSSTVALSLVSRMRWRCRSGARRYRHKAGASRACSCFCPALWRQQQQQHLAAHCHQSLLAQGSATGRQKRVHLSMSAFAAVAQSKWTACSLRGAGTVSSSTQIRQ